MTEIAEEGLRFVFAGTSIVSDWGNPAATTNRAVMTALIELGHEATFLEPRHDASLIELLKARGSEPVRAFLAAYPKLQYRTVDLPATFQASSWAGQFLATASASVALIGCPEVVADGFRQFEEAGVRYFQEETDSGRSMLKHGLEGRNVTSFQPAVLPREWNQPRHGSLLVAYDDAELARQIAEVVQPDTRIVSGKAELPDWEWVPEVDLPERYGRAARVVIVDGKDEITPVRVWLPRANGATAWGVASGDAEEIHADAEVAIGEIAGIDWSVSTPLREDVNAKMVARKLVESTL